MAFKLDLMEQEDFQKIENKKKGHIRYHVLLYFEREREQSSDRSITI